MFSSKQIAVSSENRLYGISPSSRFCGLSFTVAALVLATALLGVPTAQAVTSDIAVTVDGVKQVTANQDGAVDAKKDSDTLIGIKSMPSGTGNFEVGTVTNSGAGSPAARTNNKIEMTGGTVGFVSPTPHTISAAFGGTTLTSNQFTMTGGTIKNLSDIDLSGGYTTNAAGIANSNMVSITGEAVVDGTADTSKKINIFGGYGTVEASQNVVALTPGQNGAVTKVGTVYGGRASDNAQSNSLGNTVTIGGGGGSATVGFVYGGAGGTVTGNTVTIGNNGSAVWAYGGAGLLATGNTIIFSGNGKADYVFGGSAKTDNSTAATATGNTVIFSGSGGAKEVYGGYVSYHDNSTGVATATGNTVVISGTPVFDTVLYGGEGPSSATGDWRTDNTLELRSSGISAANIKNFQHLRFYMPATTTAGTTMLTLTDPAGVDISTPANAGATTVGVGIMGGGSSLKIGDTVNLIKTVGSLQADANIPNTVTAVQGISKQYSFALSKDPNTLIATVSDYDSTLDPGTPDPGTPEAAQKTDEAIRKSPSEGRAASVTLVTQGGDLASGRGMSSAREAASSGSGATASLGVASFGAVSGGTARYNTSSHVNVDGLSLMTGLAKRLPIGGADLLAGAFFEAGYSSYNSHNSALNGDDIRGFGDSRYMGGGLLGRVDITDGAVKGLYAETALRIGNIRSDYKSDDLNPMLGRADYDTSSTYVGINAGLGYLWDITDRASFDLYAKYFWARTSSANVEIFGDSVQFDAVNSHRTQLGARFAYEVNEYFSPYMGAAWEYEFDSTARSVVAGDSVAGPSAKGSSGMGELGVTWSPSAESVLALDLGVQGYAGVRRGVGGNLQAKFEF